MSSGEQIRQIPIKAAIGWLALLVVTTLSYWRLVVFNPQAGVFRPSEGVEAIFFESTGQPPLPILMLALWMVWRRRAYWTSRLESDRPSWMPNAACFVAAALIAGWSTHVGAPDLLVFSLQLLLLGIGGTLGGKRGRKSMLMPMLVLVLAIPIPPVLLNRLVFGLQLWTASTCSAISQLFGQPAQVFGVDIVTSHAVFRVIESCTGIRMTSALFMATFLYAEISDRTASRCLALLLCVPIVGVVVNLIRVLTIMGNPYSEVAGVHATQGIVMMAVAVLLIVAIDIAFAKVVPPASAFGNSDDAGDFRLDRSYGGVLAASFVIGAMMLVTPHFEAPDIETTPALSQLPRFILGERSNGLATDVHFLGSVAFSDRIDRGYGTGKNQVRIFVGENHRFNRRGSILSEKTGYPGNGWQLIRRERVAINFEIKADLTTFESARGIRQELHWLENIGTFWSELIHGFLGLDQSMFAGRPHRARVFRVGVDLSDDKQDQRERLIAYAQAIRSPI
jgi:exosortase